MIRSITILKPKKSLNFSESCNLGIKSSKNKYIFVANDDIIITKNSIEELVKNTDDDTITGPDSNCNLGFQTDYAYTVKDVKLVPAMTLDQVKHIIPDIYNIKPVKQDVLKRDWLAFFATMFTRKCFNDVGFMDESFIYDREDLDWCIAAKKLGKNFKQIFGSYCFHFGGISRKRKHQELGLKHDLDQEHNYLYYANKYGIKDKPILGIFCSDAWEPWDENSLNSSVSNKPSGIGGSETQVIYLSREFSKLGYKVKIFNKCKEQHFDKGYDVEYIPFQNFGEYSKKLEYDYFIASRYLDCFDIPFKSKRNFVMAHDVFLIMNGKHQHDVKQDRVEKYFCLSNRHKQFFSEYHNIPMDKILMTSNGLDFSRFENKNIKKDPNRLIYSSSPDRGLEYMMPVLDQVYKQHPQMRLHVYYGFENFRDQDYITKIKAEMTKRSYITYHGRVGQDRLAEEFLRSGIWSYFSGFSETFSITALEAMQSGACVLSSAYWGLIDTVGNAGILIDLHDNYNNIHTDAYKNKWKEECLRLLKDQKYADSWRAKGLERVKKFSWTAVTEQWSDLFLKGTWKEIQ